MNASRYAVATAESKALAVATNKRWRKKYPEKMAQQNLTQRRKLVEQIVAAYGGRCVCKCDCSESLVLFLTIDHVNNDGAEHRRSLSRDGIKRSSSALYHDLKKRGFPKKGFRLMCFNCNLGRARNGGICPRQEGTKQ